MKRYSYNIEFELKYHEGINANRTAFFFIIVDEQLLANALNFKYDFMSCSGFHILVS